MVMGQGVSGETSLLDSHTSVLHAPRVYHTALGLGSLRSSTHLRTLGGVAGAYPGEAVRAGLGRFTSLQPP